MDNFILFVILIADGSYKPLFRLLGTHLHRRNLEWIGRNFPKTISLTGQP